MKNIRNDKNEESGQSTVEFTLMLGILLFLLFLRQKVKEIIFAEDW